MMTETETKPDRAALKKQLARLRQLEHEVAELLAYSRRLDSEIDDATERHQAAARTLQERLQGADVESRVSLRVELADLNSELQSVVDDVERRREAAAQELADLRQMLNVMPAVEAALIATLTAEQQAELSAAENRVHSTKNILNNARRVLAYHEANVPPAYTVKSLATWDKQKAKSGKDEPTPANEVEKWRDQLARDTTAAAEAEAAWQALRVELLAL